MLLKRSPIDTCICTLQLQRLCIRDKIGEKKAQEKIDAQMPLETKVQMAKYVLDNSTTLESLKSQVRCQRNKHHVEKIISS